MDNQTPSDLLVEIKTHTQLSEVALAALLGISQPTVNRILKNQPGCSSKSLMAIQRAHADMKSGKLRPAEQPAAA
ncbi:DNA-binding transcriptional regulator YdaS (Cro superfamily) [Caballeronia udeis]|uniref:DNA-binding transcriptional regulator YdaS (Cro superfamily) n=1 Tax=Caballeronia udeis TaxID=1232866 RepID=A0ABW8MLW4_9BURK